MSESLHERARELIALSGALEVDDAEQNWLQAHLQECASCRGYAESVGETLSTLRARPVTADAALVRATQYRVHSRALALRQLRARAWLVCFSCIFVGLSAAMTTPLFWRACAWAGEIAGVSNWVWQSGFAMISVAPALAASAFLLAHGTHLSSDGGGEGSNTWN